MNGGLPPWMSFILVGMTLACPTQSLPVVVFPTLPVVRYHTLAEGGSNQGLTSQMRNRLVLESQQRVTLELAKQGITVVSFGNPKFLREGSVLTVIFTVQLNLGQTAHTGNTAQVSVRFEDDEGTWRFVTLGTLCCGDH
jgi:hypothetical protein